MAKLEVTLSRIESARKALKAYLDPTPLVLNPWLSKRLGCNVYLKLENMQPIGSFKIRGATYRISRLSAEEKKRGVIAASAGNHAQGVAWGCARLNVKACIVMPKVASLMKVQNTRALGAEVVLWGETYQEAFEHAQMLAQESGRVFVHAFEDSDVIAGQGTIGLELLEQLAAHDVEADLVIGSIGGGGLMAGIATAIRAKSKKTRIIGCQASGASAMVQSLKRGKISHGDRPQTFADGIAVTRVSEPVYRILKKTVDETYVLDDGEIASSVLTFLEQAKIVTEGSAAIALATLEMLAQKRPKSIRGKNVVLIVCGGNLDINLLSRIIDLGLARAGRRLRVNTLIEDRPGSLARLTETIGKAGANILQAIHDRGEPRIDQAEVELLLETRDAKHARQVVRILKESTLRVRVHGH